MRTIKGYPKEIEIGKDGVTLHDANRLLLALMCDHELADQDKHRLETSYRQERQRYLDGLYEMTDERKAALLRLERRMAAEIRNCDQRLERMMVSEKEKRDKGMLFARNIRYHLEIENFSHEDFGSTEELDLMDLLYSEDRLNTYWGITEGVTIYDKDEEDSWQHYRQDKPEEGLPTLNMLRNIYTVAWQDIEKIKKLRLTIVMDYYRS